MLLDQRIQKISLDGWLQNPTEQGFPKKDLGYGKISYWKPVNGGGSVLCSYNGIINLDFYTKPDEKRFFLGVGAARLV